jgi:hypothetical protein
MTKKWIVVRLLCVVLSGWLLNTVVYAESAIPLNMPSTMPSTMPSNIKVTSDAAAAERLSDDELSSFGCLIGTSGMFTAGYLAGPSEAIMLWGGGLLTPSNSAVLAVSIFGGLGYAGCSVGATLAPTLTWAYERMGINSLISTN